MNSKAVRSAKKAPRKPPPTPALAAGDTWRLAPAAAAAPAGASTQSRSRDSRCKVGVGAAEWSAEGEWQPQLGPVSPSDASDGRSGRGKGSTPNSAQKRKGSEPSAKRRGAVGAGASSNMAAAAGTFGTATERLGSQPSAPETKRCTRHTADTIREQLAAERAALSEARLELERGAAQQAVVVRMLLHNPVFHYEPTHFGGSSSRAFGQSLWQVAMMEYALTPIEPGVTGRQLGMRFRALAEASRNTLPRLRGLYELDKLHRAFVIDEALQLVAQRVISQFKSLYCGMLRGFARFHDVEPRSGELLVSLMARTHEEGLRMRPPGRPPREVLPVPESMRDGHYAAEWVGDTCQMMLRDSKRALSLRGTQGMAHAGQRRYLGDVPEAERPRVESHETIRRKLHQA
jgi:hypothetical protein